MGRVKRTQKIRTVTKNRWNSVTQSLEPYSVVETYWADEYVSGSDSYGDVGIGDGGSSGGGE